MFDDWKPKLQGSTAGLEQELEQLRALNLNLQNDVAETNQRSLNLKDNYAASMEEIGAVRRENEALRGQVQEHKDVLTIQIEEARKNAKTVSDLKSKLYSTETNLKELQGKSDKFQAKAGSDLISLQETLSNITVLMHEMEANLTSFASKTESNVAGININLDNIRTSHAALLDEATGSLNRSLVELGARVDQETHNITQMHERLGQKAEAAVEKVRAHSLQQIEAVTTQLEAFGAKLEDTMRAVEDVGEFKLQISGNFDALRQEIVGSAAVLTQELERRVDTTVMHVATDIETIRDLQQI